MELSVFLRLYAEIAPLRALVSSHPAIDVSALTSLFLQPTANVFDRETLYSDLCALLNLQQPPAVDAFALRERNVLWAQVAETNKLRKRFCYSDSPMSLKETRKMWRIVEAMQAEGASVRECAAMVGISQKSLRHHQIIWRVWSSLHIDESNNQDDDVPSQALSSADVVTPVASPQTSAVGDKTSSGKRKASSTDSALAPSKRLSKG